MCLYNNQPRLDHLVQQACSPVELEKRDLTICQHFFATLCIHITSYHLFVAYWADHAVGSCCSRRLVVIESDTGSEIFVICRYGRAGGMGAERNGALGG